MLFRSIKMLHECSAIYMLDGWMDSVGATIEYDFAIRTGKIVLFESNIKSRQDSLLRIQNAIHEVTGLQLNDYNTKSRKRDKFFARMLFAHHSATANIELAPSLAKVLIIDETYKIEFVLNFYE